VLSLCAASVFFVSQWLGLISNSCTGKGKTTNHRGTKDTKEAQRLFYGEGN